VSLVEVVNSTAGEFPPYALPSIAPRALGKGRGAGGPGPAAPPADEGRGTRQPVVAQQVVVSSSVRSEPNISPIDYRRKARINCYSNSSSSKILAMFPGLL
jgi:hypothetical protein